MASRRELKWGVPDSLPGRATVNADEGKDGMSDTIEIKGHCRAGFERVKEAFSKNFEKEGDVGASFAATVDGEFVVDIWAGHADGARTVPWERDTIVNVWSTTKAMAAL